MITVLKAFVVTFVAVALPNIAWAQHDAHGHQFTKAQDIKWGETPSLPGAKFAVIEGPMNEAKPFTARIRFPANYRIPPHHHGTIEHVTVISGEFLVAMGEKFDESKLTALKPGDIAIMQPKNAHFAMTKQETEVQLHGMGPWTLTYVNPEDDPRKK